MKEEKEEIKQIYYKVNSFILWNIDVECRFIRTFRNRFKKYKKKKTS